MNFNELNPEQQNVVKATKGAVLVLAGAGSGKTKAMTYRMAYLIEQGVSPRSILAVTFTNKAAAEMRDRVIALTPHIGGMWIMTFHAMCLRMLRNSPESVGLSQGFTVYDETDKKSLLKTIYKELTLDDKAYPLNLTISIISHAKEQELSPEDYLADNPRDSKRQIYYNIYKSYQQSLLNNNALDFDDLLLYGARLLTEDANAREYYSNRFEYIMVDEYQDTNYLQYKIIRLLSSKHGNLCVVGDDDQCIYEWRGANIRNILEFEHDFDNVYVVRMEQNYRSSANIIRLANSVIKHNKSRKPKELWTNLEPGAPITYRRLADEKQEAYYVATEIEALVDKGYRYSDIAVLYRKNAQSRAFEEKFSFRRLPYRVLQGQRYYERKEIKDVMAYLRLVDNPEDNLSLLRVINEPRRGIGDKSIQVMQEFSNLRGISIYKALFMEELLEALPAKAAAMALSFAEMIKSIHDERDNLSLLDIYENILNKSGYLDALVQANNIEADSRIENIMEFKSVIGEFEHRTDRDALVEELRQERSELASIGPGPLPTELGTFLETITLMSDADQDDRSQDAVSLMTMHASKGLEFPVVFMPGMENGIFPGAGAFDKVSKLEEERRLCYVGITRAKQKLYLTSATSRTLYGKTDYTTESMFLEEMDTDCLDGDELMHDRIKSPGLMTGDGGLFGSRYFGHHTYGTDDGYNSRDNKNPFDAIKYVKESRHEFIYNEDFAPGDRLCHPKFGSGMLVEQDDKTLTIAFDNYGIKKIGKGFVEISKE